jgi:hypothetical protein
MTGKSLALSSDDRLQVLLVRDMPVILDADVAKGFGTDTKRINEAVRRNPEKFTEEHTFALSAEEFAALRSQIATSNAGRGGTRHTPHVYTAKGVARLATILNTDAALRATDLIIDTFLEVQHQIVSGRKQIAISQPSRLRAEDDDDHHSGNIAKVRRQLASAVTALLDTVIDTAKDKTVRQTSQELTSGALDHVRERLRAKGLENAKLEADTMLVLAEAEKVMAEVRKTHAEADGIDIDNIGKRIAVVRELMTLVREAEPSEVVQLLTRIDTGKPLLIQSQRSLPAPDTDEDNV